MTPAPAAWLSQLAPAHALPAPGWWPLAPGWWLLAALLIIVIAGSAIVWLRPAQRRRRSALRELRRLEDNAGDDATLARGLENLLRRYALASFGRDTVARLSGEPWLAFVAAHGGHALAGESGHALLRAAYGGHVSEDRRAQWLAAAHGFLRSRIK